MAICSANKSIADRRKPKGIGNPILQNRDIDFFDQSKGDAKNLPATLSRKRPLIHRLTPALHKQSGVARNRLVAQLSGFTYGGVA